MQSVIRLLQCQKHIKKKVLVQERQNTLWPTLKWFLLYSVISLHSCSSRPWHKSGAAQQMHVLSWFESSLRFQFQSRWQLAQCPYAHPIRFSPWLVETPGHWVGWSQILKQLLLTRSDINVCGMMILAVDVAFNWWCRCWYTISLSWSFYLTSCFLE